MLDAPDEVLEQYRKGERALRRALRCLPPTRADVESTRTLMAAARVERDRRAAERGLGAIGAASCRCSRCHRPLTAPESTERGMGPVCRREAE
ncbi:MAG: hypothetical protein BGP03_00385 [Pseudonocardia sp. 73-21]|nr:MAG: hypothetical protein BGP03_00385 [Pseudonocardia sp. 73-21]